jgi:hypothetical protein
VKSTFKIGYSLVYRKIMVRFERRVSCVCVCVCARARMHIGIQVYVCVHKHVSVYTEGTRKENLETSNS